MPPFLTCTSIRGFFMFVSIVYIYKKCVAIRMYFSHQEQSIWRIQQYLEMEK